MHSLGSPHRSGRPPKEAALRLRDRYWALKLKADLPAESYSSLERLLYEDVQVSRREFGQGYSQPFALAKVASGTRGVCSNDSGVPPVVQRAEQLWPGSSEAYCSLLWPALVSSGWLLGVVRRQVPPVADAVRRRLRSQHLDAAKADLLRLTAAGIRRVGRLTHLDALALLLINGSRHGQGSHLNFMADLYATPVFSRLSRTDKTFALIADELQALIEEAHPGVLRLDDPRACSAFDARESRALNLMPF